MFHVATCHVLSRHGMSRHVMSCHVMSCHVTSRHVTSRHVTARRVMSCHVLSRRVLSSLRVSRLVRLLASCHGLSSLVMLHRRVTSNDEWVAGSRRRTPKTSKIFEIAYMKCYEMKWRDNDTGAFLLKASSSFSCPAILGHTQSQLSRYLSNEISITCFWMSYMHSVEVYIYIFFSLIYLF